MRDGGMEGGEGRGGREGGGQGGRAREGGQGREETSREVS